MPDDAARAAIERFHGTEFGGRRLTVNEAQPRAERPDRPERSDRGDRGDRRDFAPRHEMPAAEPADHDMAAAPEADMEEEVAMPAADEADMEEAA
jgi:RNA recognition motif-containing protein